MITLEILKLRTHAPARALRRRREPARGGRVDEGVGVEFETGNFPAVDPETGEFEAIDPDRSETP